MSSNKSAVTPNGPPEYKRGRSAGLSDQVAKPQPPGKAIVPILVLGMHRSGTSALARTLNLMGVNVGNEADLLPAHPTDNPTGYWERADIVALNDGFLKSAGYAWNDIGGFRASECDASSRAALRVSLGKVIGELERSAKSWLVKDPRLCLLLSQWLPLLDRCACVVVVRDPREIAASILREELRGVYTSHFLLALWEKYLRTALADLADKSALFVSYANLLANPVHESVRLMQGLGSLGVAGLTNLPESALRAFLDPRLKRSESPLHVELSHNQQVLMDWLEHQSQAPSTVVVKNVPEGAPPDPVLIEYKKVIEYVQRDSRDRALGQLADQVSGCVSVISGAQEQLSALRKEQWEQIAALRQDQGNMTEQVSALRKEQWDQISALRQDQGHTVEQLAALRKEQWEQVSSLRQDQGHSVEQLSALRKEQCDLRQDQGNMTEQVSALRKEQWDQISALRQDQGQTVEQLSALRKEQWEQVSALRQDQGNTVEQLSALRKEQWDLISVMRQELSAAISERPRLERSLSELRSHTATLESERQELLEQMVEKRRLEQRLSELQADFARVSDQGNEVESSRRDLAKQVEQLETALESTRRSRARALEAAVKIRRELDAQLRRQATSDKQ